MRILITGSTGFVAGSLGSFAARAGHEVLGLGHACAPPGHWPGSYIQADLAHGDLCPIFSEFIPDIVFHGAGRASVSASFDSPADDFRAATLTWINVLEAVRRSGLTPQVVFPSSAAVYGNPFRLPVRESEEIRPISPYGHHKAICELLAKEYSLCFGLDILVCRIFSLFGIAQRRLIVWELYEQCVGSQAEVWLQGTGKECRDFLHVDDLASALLALTERRSGGQRQARCLTLNIASGETTAVRSLGEQIRDMVAPEKDVRCHGHHQSGQPLQWSANISLLRSLIPSWRPPSLATRLEECIAAWQEERIGSIKAAKHRMEYLPHDAAVMVRDPDGKIRYWNEGAKLLYGWTSEEAIGKSSHHLLKTTFPGPLRSLEAELLEKGHWTGDLVHRRRDGSVVIVSSRWDLQRGAHGLSPSVREVNRERLHAVIS